jgi:hypothetical protein
MEPHRVKQFEWLILLGSLILTLCGSASLTFLLITQKYEFNQGILLLSIIVNLPLFLVLIMLAIKLRRSK